ncbi:MAG: hypothetical protein Q7S87_10350 [Agitococcus sp.]|nr:hypothetical protein [Agitococcus sp.]
MTTEPTVIAWLFPDIGMTTTSVKERDRWLAAGHTVIDLVSKQAVMSLCSPSGEPVSRLAISKGRPLAFAGPAVAIDVATCIDVRELDLRKGEGHRHPDINTLDQYFCLIGGRWYFGRFSEQWYGLNFSGWTGNAGLQYDTPGTNASTWDRVLQLIKIAPAPVNPANAIELQRQDFEYWCWNPSEQSANYDTARNGLGDYVDPRTDGAWIAWSHLMARRPADEVTAGDTL